MRQVEEVFFTGPATTVVEIDAADIARIIAEVCGVPDRRAIRAANRVLEYLIDVHQQAKRTQ